MIRIQAYILWITTQWYALLLSIMLMFALAVQYFQSLNLIGNQDVSNGFMLSFTFLRVPLVYIDLIPVALFLGTLFAMQQLNRSYEAVSIRAAGLSFWRMAFFPLVLVASIGLFVMLFLQPLAVHWESVAQKNLGIETGRKPDQQSSSFAHWSVENFDDGMIIFYSGEADQQSKLNDVRLFRYDAQYRVFDRIDAQSMAFEQDETVLNQVTRYVPERVAQVSDQVRLPFVPQYLQRSLTLSHLTDVSFWQLPSFINDLKAKGKDSKRFQVALHRLLSLPFFYVLAIMLAYGILGLSPRRAQYGKEIGYGFAAVLGLYIFTEIIAAFGATGLLPAVLAVWGFILAGILLQFCILLRREDG